VRLRARAKAAAELPAPRLLGAFDPILLGWASRATITGAHDGDVASGGLFRPLMLASGRAVGTWRIVASRVQLEPFASLPRRLATAFEADGDDALRYLGL
jgi:hypothetical protein